MCWVGNRTNHIKTFKVVDMTMYWKLKIPTNKTKTSKTKQNKTMHGILVMFCKIA